MNGLKRVWDCLVVTEEEEKQRQTLRVLAWMWDRAVFWVREPWGKRPAWGERAGSWPLFGTR